MTIAYGLENLACPVTPTERVGVTDSGSVMQIHLSPRHLALSAAIHAHAAAVVGQLEDYAEILAAHLVLVHNDTEKPADRFTVKAHLALRGKDLHADVSAEDIYLALDRAADKLARQLRKRKTKMTDKRRSTLQRARERVKGKAV